MRRGISKRKSSRTDRTKSILSDVLTLYTTKKQDPLTFSYEVECSAFKEVSFTLDFAGSENFMIEGRGNEKLCLETKISPFSRKEIGSIVLVDEDRRAVLKMGCSWRMGDPSMEDVAPYMETVDVKMKKEMADAKAMNFPSEIADPDCAKVKSIYSNYGKRFVDLDFPPQDDSLYKYTEEKNKSALTRASSILSFFKRGGKPKLSKKDPIEWRRAPDFMEDELHIFFEGIDPGDIRQGALGDCWFLCSITALTEFPVLVENLFPEEARVPNDAGVYTVMFCKGGMWQKVRVDDYFPCYPGGGPIYSRTHGSELWVLLLEKAYAKLHGSYEAIKSGWAYEGMMDLTGAPYQIFRLDEPKIKGMIESGLLWTKLKHCDEMNYIMSASTPGEDVYTETGKRPGKNGTGLVAGHAYTLISVKESSKGDQLVKLRNPWGSMEWTGDWSDASPLWTEQMQAEIEPLVNADDGCFWMCFADLLKYFYSINICMVRHPDLNREPWVENRKRFYVEYNMADLTAENAASMGAEQRLSMPSFVLTTGAKGGTFIVSVHQTDTRIENTMPYIDIGVSVLQVDPVYRTFTYIEGTGNNPERQNQTEEFTLPPNSKFLIVPTTTGCKLQTQALLVVQSEAAGESRKAAAAAAPRPIELVRKTGKRVVNESGQEEDEIEFTSDAYKVYEDLFHRINVSGSGFLSKEELDQHLMRTEGSPMEDTSYQWLLNTFESVERKGLTLEGFLRAQFFVFKRTGADEAKMRQELKALGYDDSMHYHGGRPVTLVVHSTDSGYTVEPKAFDSSAYLEAMKLPVMQEGTCNAFEEGMIKLYKLKSGINSMSFVVENAHSYKPLVFVLDCSASKNVCSHRGLLSHEETIPAGESRVMHHLMPVDMELEGGWTWSYAASYMWDD